MRTQTKIIISKIIFFLGVFLLLNILFYQDTFADDNVYSTEFDGMSIEKTKTFYYDQLNEIEKKIYDKLKQCTMENQSFDVSKTDLESYSFDEFSKAVQFAYAAYESDCPEITMLFSDTQIIDNIEETEDTYIVNIPLNIYGSLYKFEKSKDKLNQIVNGVNGNDSYLKLMYLWNYFLDNSQYEFAVAVDVEIGGKAAAYDHSPYGLLLGNSAVCDGYAYVCKMLCDELSIPCIIVGNAGHAWNYIEMDDGKWYAADFSANYPRDWYDDAFLMGSNHEIYRNNNNFHLSDLYIVTPGKFKFPLLSEESYQYKDEINIEDYKLVLGESTFQDKEIEFLYDVNVDGVTCTITDYEGCQTNDLIIPNEIDGYQVTQIGKYAFSNCNDLKGTVSLPESLKKIDDMAFMQCKYLEKIDMPENLNEMGIGVFMACPNLSDVDFGALLTEIKDMTCLDCTNLYSVTLNNKVLTIGNSAFASCKSLETLNLPNSVESIGDFAFSNSINLNKLNMPDSLEAIGIYAFRNTGLTQVSINKTVNKIGDAAFAECRMLEQITVDDENVNYCSVSGLLYDKNKTTIICVPAKVKEVVLPDELETIVESSFSNCQELESVTISKNVKEIQKLSFNGCEKLQKFIVNPDNSYFTSIDGVVFTKDLKKLVVFPNAKTCFSEIPKELDTIGEFSFYSAAIEEIDLSDSNVTELETAAFDDAYALTYIKLPNTIETIPNCCFYYCGQLKEIHLGSNIRKIEDSAFEGAFSLSLVLFGGTKEQWDAIQIGNLNSNIVQCKKSYNWEQECSFDKPSFEWNEDLSKCNVKLTCKIHEMCSKTESATISQSIIKEATCKNIGQIKMTATYLQYTDDKINEILPLEHDWDSGTVTKEPTETEEGIRTFTCTNPGCKETKEEKIPKTGENGGNATEQKPAQATEQKPEQSTSDQPQIGDTVTDQKTDVTYTVTENVEENKTVAYTQASDDAKGTVKVPATVTIDDTTYKVTKIEDKAFAGNKKITKVTIGSNVTEIGAGAFSGCSKLKTVTVGSKVTKIDSNAFKGCTSLTKVTLPAKTTTIGANAFNGCKKIKTITIKSTKLTDKSISKNAFKGLPKDATIKVPKKKLSAYKKLFKKKGLSGKVKVTA